MSRKLRVAFFGSPAFAVPVLERLHAEHEVVAAVSQPDKPAGRGQQVQAPAVKTLAQLLGIAVLQPPGLKEPAVQQQLRDLGAEVFVVAAYGRILPQAVLDIPPLGPWNVHGSLLPQLRGAAPIQWAIIRGARETGVSIMRMEAGLDTGPVAATARLDIGDEDTTATLSPRLSSLGADLMVATLPAIADGSVQLVRQDDSAATVAPMLRKEDGRLDFSRPRREVSCRARGVDPWPGAYGVLGGEPVKLFRPSLPAAAPRSGAPGELLGASPGGLLVACSDGCIAFAELQAPGRKRLPAAAFLTGHRPAPGARFE